MFIECKEDSFTSARSESHALRDQYRCSFTGPPKLYFGFLGECIPMVCMATLRKLLPQRENTTLQTEPRYPQSGREHRFRNRQKNE